MTWRIVERDHRGNVRKVEHDIETEDIEDRIETLLIPISVVNKVTVSIGSKLVEFEREL
jgi:hypothetical protein